jgi:SPP1 gp7 family putative phage head morphogenesis protein
LDRKSKQRETLKERRAFASAHRAEAQYARNLRTIAKHCGALAKFWNPDDPATTHWVIGALRRYAEELWPWAMATAERMLVDVARRDEAAWARVGRNAGRALRKEIAGAPTGELMRALLNEQADLITSLPRDAAARVHEWTIRGIEGSERPAAVAEKIFATGEVTRSRANIIARTEVARTASKLVEARSRWIGSDQYEWVTAGDSDVRSDHRKLGGKVFSWDDPPIAGPNGMRYHAGQGPNCRCIPSPIIPEELAA